MQTGLETRVSLQTPLNFSFLESPGLGNKFGNPFSKHPGVSKLRAGGTPQVPRLLQNTLR